MQHPVQQRATLLALAALLDLVETAGAEPIAPCLHLRAILAFLCTQGDGGRWPFDAFWKAVVEPRADGSNEAASAYLRRLHVRAAYLAIERCVGIARQCPDWRKKVQRLRRANDPETRLRDRAADLVREMAHEREIRASKGQPHTAGARRLMAKRIAAGEPLDGEDRRKRN